MICSIYYKIRLISLTSYHQIMPSLYLFLFNSLKTFILQIYLIMPKRVNIYRKIPLNNKIMDIILEIIYIIYKLYSML